MTNYIDKVDKDGEWTKAERFREAIRLLRVLAHWDVWDFNGYVQHKQALMDAEKLLAEVDK